MNFCDSFVEVFRMITDDRSLAIISGTIVCVASLFVLGTDAREIVIPVITGVFGVVTGASRASINSYKNGLNTDLSCKDEEVKIEKK